MHALDFNNGIFNQALEDYCYLLNRGYPEKGALKLTGDRYRLSTGYRNVLYRGVTSMIRAEERNKRLQERPGKLLLIDGYNVLFTILSYRLGRFVFICLDNICRDAGSLYGRNLNEEMLGECIIILTEYLKNSALREIIIYLDKPVSFSDHHQELIENSVKDYDLPAKVKMVHSADKTILGHSEGTIASSDSEILDNSSLPLFDIPLHLLESRFDASFFNLREHLIRKTGKTQL